MVNYERLYHACVLKVPGSSTSLTHGLKKIQIPAKDAFEASSRLQKLLLEWEEQYIEEVEDTLRSRLCRLNPAWAQ